MGRREVSVSEIECGLVSIIVPVYNVQDKIKRCVDSVLAQTYPYFELILVDDGSSDDSLSVCRKAAQIDERIIVVSKSNGGVSSARNAGLDRASGKYVMFFDSDDWVDTDILENMVSIQNQDKSGLTICGLSMHNGNGGVKLWYPLSSKEIEESTFSEILTDITMTGVLNSPCNKLFLRDKIKSRFNIGKSMGEDMDFNIAYIDEINSISIYWACPYHYDMTTTGSLTKQLEIQMAVALENIEHKEAFLKRHNAYFSKYEDVYARAFLQRAESFLKANRTYMEFKGFYQKLAYESGYKTAVCSHNAYNIQCRVIKFMVKRDLVFALFAMISVKKLLRRG